MTVFEFGYAALDINAVYPRDTGEWLVITLRCNSDMATALEAVDSKSQVSVLLFL